MGNQQLTLVYRLRKQMASQRRLTLSRRRGEPQKPAPLKWMRRPARKSLRSDRGVC